MFDMPENLHNTASTPEIFAFFDFREDEPGGIELGQVELEVEGHIHFEVHILGVVYDLSPLLVRAVVMIHFFLVFVVDLLLLEHVVYLFVL